jgi:hypothetical protein
MAFHHALSWTSCRSRINGAKSASGRQLVSFVYSGQVDRRSMSSANRLETHSHLSMHSRKCCDKICIGGKVIDFPDWIVLCPTEELLTSK